jgi:hypothetical protein
VPFVREAFTADVLERLGLVTLASDATLSRVNRELIFDLDSRSALIVHPYSHADYPDRYMSFVLEGKGFTTWEKFDRSDGPARIEIYIDRMIGAEYRARIVNLLSQAVAVYRNEPVGAVPIVERTQFFTPSNQTPASPH